jgi:hypothetical protein
MKKNKIIELFTGVENKLLSTETLDEALDIMSVDERFTFYLANRIVSAHFQAVTKVLTDRTCADMSDDEERMRLTEQTVRMMKSVGNKDA